MRPKTIGEQVRTWREAQGLSQRDLAERSGVFYTVIARLELGQTDPRLSTLIKLAEALGIDMVDFFTAPNKAKRPARKRAGR